MDSGFLTFVDTGDIILAEAFTYMMILLYMVHDWKSHHLPEGKSNLQWMRLSICKDYQKFAFMFERVIGLLKNKCTILQCTFQIRSLKNEDIWLTQHILMKLQLYVLHLLIYVQVLLKVYD